MTGFEPARLVSKTGESKSPASTVPPHGHNRGIQWGGGPSASPFAFSVATFSLAFRYQRPFRCQIILVNRKRRRQLRTVRSGIAPSTDCAALTTSTPLIPGVAAMHSSTTLMAVDDGRPVRRGRGFPVLALATICGFSGAA